jgi:hypothetical protein
MVLEVGTAKQLFIDQRFIEVGTGLELRVNPPKKVGAALIPDKPWEEHGIDGFGTVMEDEGVYKLWYSASGCPEEPLPDPVSCPECNKAVSLFTMYRGAYRCPHCRGYIPGLDLAQSPPHLKMLKANWQLCHAVSTDGIHWQRPDLGLVEFRGSKKNNLVRGIGDSGVFEFACMRDPHGQPENRYLAINRGARSMYLIGSSDGVSWHRIEGDVLPFTADSPNRLMWDERLNKYVAYIRGFPGERTVVRCEVEDPYKIPWPFTPGAAKVPDKEYGAVYITDELPTVMATDELDPKGTDIMTPCVVPYPHAQHVYLAFPGLFRHYPGYYALSHGNAYDARREESAPVDDKTVGRENHRYFESDNNGPLDVHLCVSRDGIHWSRPERRPYVSVGCEDEPDCGCIYNMTLGIIRRGNILYQYYVGRRLTHAPAAWRDPRTKNVAQIMRLEQRLDRFVKAEAIGAGTILTPPIRHRGKRLELNIDCGAMGEAWVELRNAANQPLPDFTLNDADPIDLNHVSTIVTWRGNANVGSTAGKPLRLFIKMRNAGLYAFQFAL